MATGKLTAIGVAQIPGHTEGIVFDTAEAPIPHYNGGQNIRPRTSQAANCSKNV